MRVFNLLKHLRHIFHAISEAAMDFLFKDRGSGKRTIKPSKDSEQLEGMMAAEESDDSDFEVGDERELDSDRQSDRAE